MTGRTEDARIETVRMPQGSLVANYGFDVTPARLVSGLITERGALHANRDLTARASFLKTCLEDTPIEMGSSCQKSWQCRQRRLSPKNWVRSAKLLSLGFVLPNWMN